jgi:hypothetical protein
MRVGDNYIITISNLFFNKRGLLSGYKVFLIVFHVES